jgi:hypothetical protein
MSESPSRTTTWATRIGIGLLSLLVVSASYYGAYRLSLDSEAIVVGYQAFPAYRLDWLGDYRATAYTCLTPAFLVDRTLRPAYWNDQVVAHRRRLHGK